MEDVYKKLFTTEKSTMNNYYITTESVLCAYVCASGGTRDFTLSFVHVSDITIKTGKYSFFVLCYSS